MMTQDQFLTWLTARLDAAEVEYAVCGSRCSNVYGQPRSTLDIDLVIDPTRQRLARFLRSIADECYYSEAAVDAAYGDRGMFNVIHIASAQKADLIFRKDTPFGAAEFERRRPVDIAGVPMMALSPEDVILSKLEWCMISPSERQLRDAASVIRMQGTQLDRDYLNAWAHRLGVVDLLATIERDAETR